MIEQNWQSLKYIVYRYTTSWKHAIYMFVWAPNFGGCFSWIYLHSLLGRLSCNPPPHHDATTLAGIYFPFLVIAKTKIMGTAKTVKTWVCQELENPPQFMYTYMAVVMENMVKLPLLGILRQPMWSSVVGSKLPNAKWKTHASRQVRNAVSNKNQMIYFYRSSISIDQFL